ncbi:unnamed protein product [Caenorhabditis angaria]|uniref:MARVEL domain-containing protein n=1 Tax=Caenorhabditis angaria TaxID=860376 RepID=A0A9P1IBQ9_9PELO|nr:unnamed protein product [Caenorhabditis angaria]
MPHFFKPLQALTAIVLAICVGSTGMGDNGILWFTIIVSLFISATATIIFALKKQDEILDSLTNGSVSWNIVELVYSFILSILSVICVWLSFSFANRTLFGTSAGYIAAGLFFILQTILYAIPSTVIYREVQASADLDRQSIFVEPAYDASRPTYQDL